MNGKDIDGCEIVVKVVIDSFDKIDDDVYGVYEVGEKIEGII